MYILSRLPFGSGTIDIPSTKHFQASSSCDTRPPSIAGPASPRTTSGIAFPGQLLLFGIAASVLWGICEYQTRTLNRKPINILLQFNELGVIRLVPYREDGDLHKFSQNFTFIKILLSIKKIQ